MSNAVCHHGAISFEFGDSILGTAIVAIIPPQTAHTDRAEILGPLGNVGSRNRYPRTIGKLRESTEINMGIRRSDCGGPVQSLLRWFMLTSFRGSIFSESIFSRVNLSRINREQEILVASARLALPFAFSFRAFRPAVYTPFVGADQ